MAVRILIKRRVTPEKEEQLIPLIMRLRLMASQEPGYISGETLRNADDPESYLVVSTWQNLEDWEAWFGSKERASIQDQIDKLLGMETDYEIFKHPEKQRFKIT